VKTIITKDKELSISVLCISAITSDWRWKTWTDNYVYAYRGIGKHLCTIYE